VNQRKSKGIIAFITKQMKHQPKAMVAGEDRQTIRERIVGQAITDAHDVYVKQVMRPIGSNPARFSDDEWMKWIGRAAIKATEASS
jgi:hypothetical protein